MKKKWLDFFRKKENDKASENEQNETLREIVKNFISNFRHQGAQYKIVWSVRILCWALIFAVAVFGALVRILEYFK